MSLLRLNRKRLAKASFYAYSFTLLYPIYWPFPVSQLNKTNKPNARSAQMFKQLNMNLQEIFVKTQIPTVTLAKAMNVHVLKKFALAGSRTPLAIWRLPWESKTDVGQDPFLQSPTGTCHAPCLCYLELWSGKLFVLSSRFRTNQLKSNPYITFRAEMI